MEQQQQPDLHLNPVEIGQDIHFQNAAFSIKLPNFWSHNPDSWFLAVEAQFRLARIVRDETKYNYVLSALSQESINTILDIIRTPPLHNLYDTLKNALISRHTSSEESRLEQLISSSSFGDGRPSDSYRHMLTLASNNNFFNDRQLYKLWARKLPSAINVALISVGDRPIPELLEIADKIWELERPNVFAFKNLNNSYNKQAEPQTSFSVQDGSNNLLFAEITRLRADVAILNEKIDSVQQNIHPVLSTPYNKFSNSSSNPKTSTLCWYHTKFGQRANKCIKPCNFSTLNNKNLNE